jgi:hypothetical protein
MPELGSYGSVRGARGNSRPYRESDLPTIKTALMTVFTQSGPITEVGTFTIAALCSASPRVFYETLGRTAYCRSCKIIQQCPRIPQIRAVGLFMFYAWLPLLYASIGFDVGLLLGRAFTGDVGTSAVVLGLASAFILGAASCRGGQTANPRSRCRRRDRARKMTRALARGANG